VSAWAAGSQSRLGGRAVSSHEPCGETLGLWVRRAGAGGGVVLTLLGVSRETSPREGSPGSAVGTGAWGSARGFLWAGPRGRRRWGWWGVRGGPRLGGQLSTCSHVAWGPPGQEPEGRLAGLRGGYWYIGSCQWIFASLCEGPRTGDVVGGARRGLGWPDNFRAFSRCMGSHPEPDGSRRGLNARRIGRGGNSRRSRRVGRRGNPAGQAGPLRRWLEGRPRGCPWRLRRGRGGLLAQLGGDRGQPKNSREASKRFWEGIHGGVARLDVQRGRHGS
jgi:hypothetical protein